uniref:Uncharacterized protein n=1 Tax=Anas platyrhynchos TaxID=8839 RepID=A0A8B9QP90_ANAPL
MKLAITSQGSRLAEPGRPSLLKVHPRLTHAGRQVNQDVVALQLPQQLEQAAHGGPAGAAALPLVQQSPGGVWQSLQPPDLQIFAAQLLGQRRPVGGGGGAGVEVESEAAPHAVVKSHHGHGRQLRGEKTRSRARSRLAGAVAMAGAAFGFFFPPPEPSRPASPHGAGPASASASAAPGGRRKEEGSALHEPLLLLLLLLLLYFFFFCPNSTSGIHILSYCPAPGFSKGSGGADGC